MSSDEVPVQIAAAPKKDQLVEYNDKTFKTVQEGKAFILVPPKARTSVDPQAKVKAKTGIYPPGLKPDLTARLHTQI